MYFIYALIFALNILFFVITQYLCESRFIDNFTAWSETYCNVFAL